MDMLVRAHLYVLYPSVGNLGLIKVLPSVDPNQAQNRVPLQIELETLRNIRSEKRQLADMAKRQLEQAEAAHKRIQARHDNLLRELEVAQTELNMSHDYLISLQQQLTLFQAEDDRLAGLIQPIRRLTDDILSNVFKWVIELASEKKGSDGRQTIASLSNLVQGRTRNT
jgi:hypothetical protein